MKHTATILLIFVCSSLVNAAEKKPPDYKYLKTTRDRKVEEIDRKFQQELRKLQVKYTKRGDLESANFIASALKEIEEKNLTIKNQIAEIRSNNKFADFKKGVRVNPEPRSTLSFHDIPEAFRGFEVEKIKNMSTAPLAFEVKNDGLVFVVAEKSAAEVLMRDGWKPVDHASIASPDTMEHYRKISILEKVFEAGEYTIPVKRSKFGCRLLKHK